MSGETHDPRPGGTFCSLAPGFQVEEWWCQSWHLGWKETLGDKGRNKGRDDGSSDKGDELDKGGLNAHIPEAGVGVRDEEKVGDDGGGQKSR